MINDTVKATGAVSIVLKDNTGNVKQKIDIPNLVVTVGKEFIASRIAGSASNVMQHMAVGTNSTAANASQTALLTEIGRASLLVSGGTPSANVVTFQATFAEGVGTGAITEAGIFNNSPAGTMLARTTFAVVNKDSLDTLTINWAVTIS